MAWRWGTELSALRRARISCGWPNDFGLAGRSPSVGTGDIAFRNRVRKHDANVFECSLVDLSDARKVYPCVKGGLYFGWREVFDIRKNFSLFLVRIIRCPRANLGYRKWFAARTGHFQQVFGMSQQSDHSVCHGSIYQILAEAFQPKDNQSSALFAPKKQMRRG